MSRENELAKNTIVLATGQFLPKVVSIVTLPILTDMLTKAEYGTYDLITTLIMLLLPVVTLQIQSSAFRFLIERRGDEKKSTEIITNILFVTFPISLIVSAILIFLLPGVGKNVAVAIGIYFFLDITNISFSQIVRGLGMNKAYSISAILLSFVNGIGIVIGLGVLKRGLFSVIVVMCIANFVAIVYLGFQAKLNKYINFKYISCKMIKELIAYSWPMIPNNLSNWVLKMSDRFVITAVWGIEANAVYAAANKVPNMLAMAQSVFVMAWQENASIAVKDKDASAYYSKMFDTMLRLMVGSTAVLIAMTPIMFKLLIKGEYTDAYMQMPILILGMFFYAMSAFQGGIYIAHKKTKSVGISTIVAAIINLLIDLLLIRSLGITAGSISTLIAYFVLYIFRMFHSLSFQPMNYRIKFQIILLLFILFMLVFCYLNDPIFNLINIILGGVMFFVLNKDIIRSILKKCKNRMR